MPAGDGTGPAGMGPRTGRAMGYCTGYGAPGWAHPGHGRGFARGRGYAGRPVRGGWGWRHQVYASGLPRWARWGPAPAAPYGAPYATPTREQEAEMLRGEAEWLQEQLSAISQRMEELSQE